MNVFEHALPVITDVADVCGKRVLVRASLDVPIIDGVVQNHFRITRAIPTISWLRAQGAKVIILTHVGRDPRNSTQPLCATLQQHLPVSFVPHVIGDAVHESVARMEEGDVILLENVRAHREEEINDQTFAETLASYADIYVNDAFAVSHRAHASIVGIPHYIPAYAGITFAEEYEALTKAFTPEHPSLFILGGAKFETKAPLIEAYANTYTHTFIGGALANDFLKGKGYEVGTSLLSSTDLRTSPLIEQENIITPIDVVAVSERGAREVACDAVERDEVILDVGTRSIEELAPRIRTAHTILWNGPLGNYEAGYDAATKACARLIAESDAFSIVGGGDTVAAIESLGLSGSFGFLSTAGGAMLEFLEKRTLPGIEALVHNRK